MNHTSIEWVRNPDGSVPGYSWNPITGCLGPKGKGPCPYCYARKLANGRLKAKYLANSNVAPIDTRIGFTFDDTRFVDPFYPRFWPERLKDIERPPYPFSAWVGNAPNTIEWMAKQPPNFHAKRKRIGIFTCDMSDLFGNGVPEGWTRQVLDAIKENSIDRFYLLTKQPQNLIKFSPFPPNCWVGITVTNQEFLPDALRGLLSIDAKVKYLSCEPLLGPLSVSFFSGEMQWVIIGAMTGTLEDIKKGIEKAPIWNIKDLKPMPLNRNRWSLQPPISWVSEIVAAADKAGCAVFLKDNLKPLLLDYWNDKTLVSSWMHRGEFRDFDIGLRKEMPTR